MNKNSFSKTNLMQYVKEALQKIDGLYIPVKASFFDQIFIKNLNPSKIFPNPRDEFCSDEVGPNYEIVEKYVKQITKNKENEVPLFDEPLIIEKNETGWIYAAERTSSLGGRFDFERKINTGKNYQPDPCVRHH